jgi:hypothetical protein
MISPLFSDSRNVVVVLGAGRSGTSLLMQIMAGFGLQVSGNLIPANVSNPEGFYEHTEFKDIQTELYSCLNTTTFMPLPEGWLGTNCAKVAKTMLHQVLVRLLEENSGIFGIKDPRISTFLPLWTRLFNPLRVKPNYILAVRGPRSVVSSFIRQYNDTGYIAELTWLLRTLEALEYTAADCFIVHYEDWFSNPETLARELLDYIGLDNTFKGNLSEVLTNTIKPNLNRASRDDNEIHNPYVLKLYSAIKECNGADFDRDRLMAVVKECRQTMEGFKGWYQLAHRVNKKLADTQTRLEKATAESAKVKALEDRIKEFEEERMQHTQLVAQLQKLLHQFDHWTALSQD